MAKRHVRGVSPRRPAWGGGDRDLGRWGAASQGRPKNRKRALRAREVTLRRAATRQVHPLGAPRLLPTLTTSRKRHREGASRSPAWGPQREVCPCRRRLQRPMGRPTGLFEGIMATKMFSIAGSLQAGDLYGWRRRRHRCCRPTGSCSQARLPTRRAGRAGGCPWGLATKKRKKKKHKQQSSQKPQHIQKETKTDRHTQRGAGGRPGRGGELSRGLGCGTTLR